MNRADLLVKAEQIAAFYGNGKQIKSDADSWLTCCPAHEDSTPSLHISVTDRILYKCHGGCSQSAVIAQLKADGQWVQTAPSGDKASVKSRNEINIPAHRIPDLDQIKVGRQKPTAIYTYVTADNEPAFWVLRLDRPGMKKVIVPYSSVRTPSGNDEFELALNCTVRPLYRLNEITASVDKPIMVVEGEKTVEAAQQIFPDYLVTTWSGGTGGVKKSLWDVLADRDVTLWPDNDNPGINAMIQVAGLINGANPKNFPKLVFDRPIEDLPEGWDLADEADQDTHSPHLLLSRAQEISPEKIKGVAAQSVDAGGWIKKYAEKYVKVLEGGTLRFYNLQSMSAAYEGASPYAWVNNVKTLKEVEPIKVFDVMTQKQVYAVDYWLEDVSQPIAGGLVYDPSTSERLVKQGGGVFLNTFPGFAHRPVECPAERLDPFLRHIATVLGPTEAAFLLDYIAHMVQFTTQKPGVMVILTGKPGVGKTVICDIIARMLGKQNAVIVDSAAFTQSNFNGLFSGKLFVTINELNVAARRDHTLTGKIKSWITDENYTVNAKFQPQRNERSYHRFVATTNSDIPFPIDLDDRRIALFRVSSEHKDDQSYFAPLFRMLSDTEALSGLMHFFTQHKIVNSVMRPPETAERSMAYHAEDPVVKWLLEILDTGVLPKDIREVLPDTTRDWVRHGVVIPRSLVVESVMSSVRMNVTKNYITQRLSVHIPRRSCLPEHVNNQMRHMVYDPKERSYQAIKDRLFEFYPLHKQREVFEEIVGQKINWSPIGIHKNPEDEEEKNNVVPLRVSDVI